MRNYGDGSDPRVLDGLVFAIDLLIQHLSQLVMDEQVIDTIAQAMLVLSSHRDLCDQQSSVFRLGVTHSSRLGMPRYELFQEQLEHLLHSKFTCSAIASMLGVSLRTVRRRMTEMDFQ